MGLLDRPFGALAVRGLAQPPNGQSAAAGIPLDCGRCGQEWSALAAPVRSDIPDEALPRGWWFQLKQMVARCVIRDADA